MFECGESRKPTYQYQYINLNKIEDLVMSKNIHGLYAYINTLPLRVTNSVISGRCRGEFTHFVSWAIPDADIISSIIEFSADKTIIDIAAGRGLWSALLRIKEKKVIAIDNFSEHENHSYTEVLDMDVKCATSTFLSPEKAPNSVLMLIWPPYLSSLAVNTLQSFRKNGGTQLIYIGETPGGCNADDQFFDELSKNWTEVRKNNIPQWYTIHDYCYFYQLKINIE